MEANYVGFKCYSKEKGLDMEQIMTLMMFTYSSFFVLLAFIDGPNCQVKVLI